jgi:hypothetical protein
VIKVPKKKYTPKQDVQLGKEAASEVRKQYPIIEARSCAKSKRVNSAQQDRNLVPNGAVLVHHPSLVNAGEGCRAVASRCDAEAGLPCL